MKKYISVIVAAVMASSIICACGNQSAQSASAAGTPEGSASEAVSEAAGDSDISIVTTIFPEYDWVKNIAGENPANAEITMLLDSGVDLHSYQPTAEDIAKIANCDMFIYVADKFPSFGIIIIYMTFGFKFCFIWKTNECIMLVSGIFNFCPDCWHIP